MPKSRDRRERCQDEREIRVRRPRGGKQGGERSQDASDHGSPDAPGAQPGDCQEHGQRDEEVDERDHQRSRGKRPAEPFEEDPNVPAVHVGVGGDYGDPWTYASGPRKRNGIETTRRVPAIAAR